MIHHDIHMITLYASAAVGMCVFVFVFRHVLFVPRFVLSVCSCSDNGVRCQPCLKVHKSINATISNVCVRLCTCCTYVGAATLVMFEMDPSSLHGVASPHLLHKADTLHRIIKGG